MYKLPGTMLLHHRPYHHNNWRVHTIVSVHIV